MQRVWKTWHLTAKIVTSHRKLWIPFLMTALVEASFLGCIWLAPQPPFSVVFAPPMRYFFGERVLHYPAHLWFLYHAMKHTNLVASLLVGAFMTGVACAMVQQLHEGTPLSFRTALMNHQVRYRRVAFLWLIAWGIAKGSLELAGRYAPKTIWMFWVLVTFTVVLQALLSYIIPAAVFERTSWWKALWHGVRESCQHPLSTLLVVIGPSALVITFAAIFSPARLAQWMTHTTAPEIALVWTAARLMVWTIADALLTISIAHLWWLHRAPAYASEVVKLTQPSAAVSRRRLQESSVVT